MLGIEVIQVGAGAAILYAPYYLAEVVGQREHDFEENMAMVLHDYILQEAKLGMALGLALNLSGERLADIRKGNGGLLCALPTEATEKWAAPMGG